MLLNERLIIENMRSQYKKQLAEVNKLLSKDLTIKLKNDDVERGIPKGTTFVIDSVGSNQVIIKRILSDSDDIKLDSYRAKTFNIDYKELETKFELA
jgi:hypothetical protein